MLLEDDDDARARLGADLEIQPASFSNAQDEFKAADTAQMAFAEALIGNFDWCLRMTADDKYRCDARRILWNVVALRGGGRTFPLIYDFDVSGMVAGRHTWFGDVYNEAFVSSKSHAEVEVLGQVQRTRALFARGVLDATRARFTERKAEAYRRCAARLDEPGRRRIQEYMDAFYDAIGSDDAFYRPVVTAPNTMPYHGRSRRRCLQGARRDSARHRGQRAARHAGIDDPGRPARHAVELGDAGRVPRHPQRPGLDRQRVGQQRLPGALTARRSFSTLCPARAGAPPVRGKGVSSHPSGSTDNSNLLPA